MNPSCKFSQWLAVFCFCFALCSSNPYTMAQMQLTASDISLCSLAGAPVANINWGEYVYNPVNTPLTFSIVSPDPLASFVINPDGTFTCTPAPDLPNGAYIQFVYQVCYPNGDCAQANGSIVLAEIESLPPPNIIYDYQTATGNATTTICYPNLGTSLQNSGVGSLYMVWVTNNTNLGTLAYSSPDCVTYTALAAQGQDTIQIRGCGDAPPPAFYTCNGYETLDVCSYTRIVLNIGSSDFTEYYAPSCGTPFTVPNLGFPTWIMPSISQQPNNGTAQIVPNGNLSGDLVYTPQPGFQGFDTVVVECAHATQITCETGVYVFFVTCAGFEQVVVEQTTPCGTPLNLGYLSGSDFPGAVAQFPTHGYLTIENGNNYTYTPPAQFVGTDTIIINCAFSPPFDGCITGIFVIHSNCYTYPQTGTFSENLTTTCGTTLDILQVGCSGLVIPQIIGSPNGGTAVFYPGDFCNFITYTPHYGFEGIDTITVSCAQVDDEEDTCLTGQYIIDVQCDITPVVVHIASSITCDSTALLGPFQGGWQIPPTIIQAPIYGTAQIVNGNYVLYTPNPNFVGTDSLTIDCAQPAPDDGCIPATLLFSVDCDNAINPIPTTLSVSLSVLPNTIRLHCPTLNSNATASLHNINGQNITQTLFDNNTAQAELSTKGLPAGLYIVQVVDPKGRFVAKIVLP